MDKRLLDKKCARVHLYGLQVRSIHPNYIKIEDTARWNIKFAKDFIGINCVNIE